MHMLCFGPGPHTSKTFQSDFKIYKSAFNFWPDSWQGHGRQAWDECMYDKIDFWEIVIQSRCTYVSSTAYICGCKIYCWPDKKGEMAIIFELASFKQKMSDVQLWFVQYTLHYVDEYQVHIRKESVRYFNIFLNIVHTLILSTNHVYVLYTVMHAGQRKRLNLKVFFSLVKFSTCYWSGTQVESNWWAVCITSRSYMIHMICTTEIWVHSTKSNKLGLLAM